VYEIRYKQSSREARVAFQPRYGQARHQRMKLDDFVPEKDRRNNPAGPGRAGINMRRAKGLRRGIAETLVFLTNVRAARVSRLGSLLVGMCLGL
jgi:hypothetical protein